MPKLSANEAKARFGELLDRARQEPITIEKHGRPVAVVMSTEEFEQLQSLKLEHLQSEVALGLKELDEGKFVEVDSEGLRQLAAQIKTKGRQSVAE